MFTVESKLELMASDTIALHNIRVNMIAINNPKIVKIGMMIVGVKLAKVLQLEKLIAVFSTMILLFAVMTW